MATRARMLAVFLLHVGHAEAAPVYELDWNAQGMSFFDGFDFNTTDANHGSAHYLERELALQAGVAEAFPSHAILRTGTRSQNASLLKRDSINLHSKKGWKYFLAVVKLSHMPFGCGVWPALWTLGTDKEWPEGGELDVLEWAHDFPQQSSFHTGHSNRCKLDKEVIEKYGPEPDSNKMDYDCVTDYGIGKLGCGPNKGPIATGADWSNQGGVVVIERTPDFAKIFHIPASELPADVESESPNPEEWSKWLVSYYPFAESEAKVPGSCPDPANVMSEHKLILNIGMCGDWAGPTWNVASSCVNKVGPEYPAQCKVLDPLTTQEGFDHDCCTKFIYDADGSYGTDQLLGDNAFFNISWIKVFTPTAEVVAPSSATLLVV